VKAAVKTFQDKSITNAETGKTVENDQWCFGAIIDKAAPLKCNFKTESNKHYLGALYFRSTDNHFYKSDAMVNFTAPDNGGKMVALTFTFPYKLDVVKNNDEVRQMACKVSEALQIATHRVYDHYGGTCKKVGFLPEETEVKVLRRRFLRRFLATANATANATATNATTNAT